MLDDTGEQRAKRFAVELQIDLIDSMLIDNEIGTPQS